MTVIVKTFLKDWEFQYEQLSGRFYLADPQNGRALVARGYSGKGIAINDPSYQDRVAEGPIPRGLWRILSPIRHQRLGELSFSLAPLGHKAEGRSGFYIHGDNRQANNSASSGCIILNREARAFLVSARTLMTDRLRVI